MSVHHIRGIIYDTRYRVNIEDPDFLSLRAHALDRIT
jgi:hypothetical protein